jgi:hypothetical protein
MKVDPLAVRAALRLIGMVLVGCRALAVLGPWGELCSTVGVAMVAWAQNGPGAVQATNIEAILQAAQKAVPSNMELRIRRTPLPPEPDDAKVLVGPVSK